MKTAVVYYSRTGHTKEVATQFNDVERLEIKPTSNNPNQHEVTFIESPNVQEFEHLIFAAPVHGFQLCKVMKAYIEQLDDLQGKIIDIFITHHFRFSWLGGTQALVQMRKLIESKHGRVRYQTSINWKSSKKDKDIDQMISSYTSE